MARAPALQAGCQGFKSPILQSFFLVNIEQKLCEELKISPATLKNWQKEKLIPPLPAELTDDYLKQIRQNTKNKLSSRANRSLSSKKQTLHHGLTSPERKKLLSSLVQLYEASNLTPEEAVFSLCYRCLVCENLLEPPLLSDTLIARQMLEWKKSLEEKAEASKSPLNPSLFDSFFIPNEDDDLIGAFYQSILSLSKKSGSGSFYTPQSLLKDIHIPSDKSVYDPCCGSGNILLKVLSKNHQPDLIFASDIDEIALKICRVNLVLFFHNPDIKAKIFYRDFIFLPDKELGCANTDKTLYDYIITNPPWGAVFSANQKTLLKEKYPLLKTSESFSLCLYNAFFSLSEKASLYFFLPKSFLNVSKHKKIRQFLLEQDCRLKIYDFGNAFKGVVSQTILLKLEKCIDKDWKNKERKIESSAGIIPQESILPPDYFIPLFPPDKLFINQKLLERFPYITLKNQAIFGMGIVTGNNKAVFRQKKSDTSSDSSDSDESADRAALKKEPVYRGKDIHPYQLSETNLKIQFNKDDFQQSAPEKLYRQKKIVYRFIADHPICCIDEKGCLFLNSANFFIPSQELNYPWESIVCLFNSSFYAEYYKNTFASLKILRSHLEKLPIFLFTQDQHKQLKELYDKANSDFPQKNQIQAEIDDLLHHFLCPTSK